MKQKNNHVVGNEEEPFNVGEPGDSSGHPDDWHSYGKNRLRRQLPWVWLVVILLLIGMALFWIFYERGGKKRSEVKKETPAASTSAVEGPRTEGGEPRKKVYDEIRVPLTASDEPVRQYAVGLAANPLMDASLKEKDLVRRFVTSVSNIARGESPRPLIEFLAPRERFSVKKKGNRFFFDPSSYRRYDSMVSFFVSMDEEKCLELFQRFHALLDEAYTELGHQGGGFDEALVEAANSILAVPVREGAMELYEKPLHISYGYMDEKLESLNDAQKQFLRMGPENLKRIKQKLHRLMEVLQMTQKLHYRP